MRPRTALAALLFVLTTACGSKGPDGGDGQVSTGSGESGSNSEDSTQDGGDPFPDVADEEAACDCWEEDVSDPNSCDHDDLWEDVPGCEASEPCPLLTVSCPMEGMDLYDCMPMFEYGEQALDCMLDAFAKRTPGRYDIEGDQDYGIYSGQSQELVRIREDGVAVYKWCLKSDVEGPRGPSETRDLAEPAHFEACLEDPSPAQRYKCLHDGLLGGETLSACE